MGAPGLANSHPVEPAVDKGQLPDPFLKPGGGRVAAAGEWPARAAAWRDLIVGLEYGGLPPRPEAVEVETLCHSAVRAWPGAPRLWSLRINCRGGERPFSLTVRLLFPDGAGPFPAIVYGDGCWWYATEEIARLVVEGGCALAMFNRTEMAEDLGYGGVPDKTGRSGGLYDVYPGMTFGALSAWAWGCHRVVDLLCRQPFIDPERIAVTGHSRGGKTALLAGATDGRIALVNDNASGEGGGAAFRYVGNGGETLNIVNVFPSWFGPGLREYPGREEALPFDQHCLLAAIAPRLLLMTYGLNDRWSNPEGMVQCHWAAREVYRFLGAGENIAFLLRPGGHRHAPEDWRALMDFIGVHWLGREPAAPCGLHPYAHLRPAFSWQAPARRGATE